MQRILVEQDRTVGIELADGGDIRAEIVVLAAGAWSRGIEGLPAARRPPVLPIKGQMMSLCMDPAAPLVSMCCTSCRSLPSPPILALDRNEQLPRRFGDTIGDAGRARDQDHLGRAIPNRPRLPEGLQVADQDRGEARAAQDRWRRDPATVLVQARVIRVPMDRGIHGNAPHIPNCRLYRPSLFRC